MNDKDYEELSKRIQEEKIKNDPFKRKEQLKESRQRPVAIFNSRKNKRQS